MQWKDLTIEQRTNLVYRRYQDGADISTLSQETGINPISLNRKLQMLRRQELPAGEPAASKPKADKRRASFPDVKLRACIWDIETTNFVASSVQDHLVTSCVLPLDGGDVITTSIAFKDRRNDKRVLKEAIEVLAEFDIIAGHNVQAFDLNFLYTRAVAYHGLTLPKSWLVLDTYQMARRIALKVESKSLANLTAFFGIEGEKTKINRPTWLNVDSNDEDEFNDTLAQIEYHCQADVRANKGVLNALWALDPFPAFKRTKW